MRHQQTDAESLLWWRLRRNQLGVSFRRQHPIGRYIVDFACLERRLIVEADGSQHGGRKDDERDEFLRSAGFLVLRFWSWDVISDLEWVVYEITEALKTRVPPSNRLRRLTPPPGGSSPDKRFPSRGE